MGCQQQHNLKLTINATAMLSIFTLFKT